MHTALVILDGKEHEITIEDNEVLFDACDKNGLKLPHGCLAGSCGACKSEVLQGKENLSDPSTVEKDTLACIVHKLAEIHGPKYVEGKTIRLACRAKVKGNIAIKPIS